MASMPTGEPTVPDLLKIIEGMRDELKELARSQSPEPANSLHKDHIVFSFSGPLVVAQIESGPK